MILLGKNSQGEYKTFEGSIQDANKTFPDYDWLDSFENKEEAGIARNALILDIPIEAYKMLRHLVHP